ncbi:hypothetical protein BJV82DRAFT_512741 [Fennellomyces sp. T-0311]|nr:hypothetical protein BJV82DRAFT_512741 [Fennellomyces sp. T-0311]
MSTTATTTKRSSKRFSFASFSLFKSSSPAVETGNTPSPASQQPPSEDDDARRRRRREKSQSLYVQSFRHLTPKKSQTQYDPAEATQANRKEIRSTIRRSLSAVLYATPQKTDSQKSSSSAGLVPVLVTQELSDRHGGMIMSEQKEEEQPKKKQPVEYDNTLDIMPEKDQLVIIWQGYGYTHSAQDVHAAKAKLDDSFEKEVWTEYRGLIHPLHLFQDQNEDDKWAALSVDELRRYFDNYGSMLLKLRDASMMRQQKQYLVMDSKKDDWLLPQAQSCTA